MRLQIKWDQRFIPIIDARKYHRRNRKMTLFANAAAEQNRAEVDHKL